MRDPAIKTILLILLFAGTSILCGAMETIVTYRSQQGIPLSASGSLRRLESFLKEQFPKTPYRKRALTIDIIGGRKPLPPVTGNLLEVDFFRLQREDLTLYSEAGGALLNALGKAPEGFRLPLFLCGVFRHRERTARSEGRFLGNNRRLRSVESFLRAGTLPGLQTLLTRVPAERDQAECEWYDDHARLLWELIRRDGFKGKAEEVQKTAAKLLSKEINAEKIHPVLWGHFNLLPPELLDGFLKKLLELRVPKLDHMNEVTGLTEKIDAGQLPVKLRKHPQRREICKNFADLLSRQGMRFPAVFKRPLRQLGNSTLRLGRSAEFEREYLDALARLEECRRLYGARSAELDRLESQTPFPVKMWKRSLKSNSSPGEILPLESKRYLKRIEEYYTGI